MNKNLGKLLGYIGIPVLLSAIVFRFVLFYFRSDGFSGMSMIFPLLAIGILIFALITSGFFAAWVYQDCKKRNDDGILWAVIIFITTPLIGLLIYFLRRCEMKQSCDACGHLVSLRAKFCEECGSKIERREEMKDMEMKRTHHISYIVIGAVSMILMLACLTGFIVSAVYGKGINSDINSNDRVWNMGAISMNYQSMKDGVWTLDFKSASDGFIAQAVSYTHLTLPTNREV